MYTIHQSKIYAVSTFAKGQCLRTVALDLVGGIELLDIPQVTGFCTVAEDGTVSYYKKEAALES